MNGFVAVNGLVAVNGFVEVERVRSDVNGFVEVNGFMPTDRRAQEMVAADAVEIDARAFAASCRAASGASGTPPVSGARERSSRGVTARRGASAPPLRGALEVAHRIASGSRTRTPAPQSCSRRAAADHLGRIPAAGDEQPARARRPSGTPPCRPALPAGRLEHHAESASSLLSLRATDDTRRDRAEVRGDRHAPARVVPSRSSLDVSRLHRALRPAFGRALPRRTVTPRIAGSGSRAARRRRRARRGAAA